MTVASCCSADDAWRRRDGLQHSARRLGAHWVADGAVL